jgi:hypothetical protein
LSAASPSDGTFANGVDVRLAHARHIAEKHGWMGQTPTFIGFHPGATGAEGHRGDYQNTSPYHGVNTRLMLLK